eukprot:TRINITY_DN3960_c0_g1_i6.p1 TRINITY_DN3960_c0_g1~~TRINITY_DN3960_c0_g1_i6.p1  ORF type:complete len:374 (-),score=66.55 TRINITY_DN3960_c0_g1_i6:18-1139(-)
MHRTNVFMRVCTARFLQSSITRRIHTSRCLRSDAKDVVARKGHLEFTKSSLYKLCLPLPAQAHSSDGQKATEAQEKSDTIFLLHSAQPLSYITDMIRHESPSSSWSQGFSTPNAVTFHSGPDPSERWCASTGIGDFLRDAAIQGSFKMTVMGQDIHVSVPTFAQRTRFLRESLHRKMTEIERLTKVKDECDAIAKRTAKRFVIMGAGVLATWWLGVGFATFYTNLGWDTMEPITYLTGIGMVYSGYLWFLYHNREISYSSVFGAATSQQSHKLYLRHNFDPDRYAELIKEVKKLRHAIKRAGRDYGIDWEQGMTEEDIASVQRALQVVRREDEGEGEDEDHEEKKGEQYLESEADLTAPDEKPTVIKESNKKQ